jgi:NADH:ubiquinone oxidoreductase subunit 4 (subunit M)
MILILLLLVPLVGIFAISAVSYRPVTLTLPSISQSKNVGELSQIKSIALFTSIVNLFISLIVFILFNFSNNQFQFVQEYHKIYSFDFYLGVDGISIYFVLLTTIIMPIALLSN